MIQLGRVFIKLLEYIKDQWNVDVDDDDEDDADDDVEEEVADTTEVKEEEHKVFTPIRRGDIQ